jgi:hypothetical protein
VFDEKRDTLYENMGMAKIKEFGSSANKEL